ncbi:MAG: lactate utilization protein [Pseudomonadota bacterium]
MQNPDLVRLMTEKAEAVAAIVSKIESVRDAFRYAIDLTVKQQGKTIVAAGLAPKDQAVLKKACDANGVAFLEFPLRPHADKIHTSITLADWGIAETGTLVLDSTSEDVRLATMLAETHVAVLPGSKIKPDAIALEDELDRILKTKTASYTAFITGASRTADIERVLAIGVHGPQELHILILEENDA